MLVASPVWAQATIEPCPAGGVETTLSFALEDDGSTSVSLAPVFTAARPFRFAGNDYTSMFVNINGNLTFDSAFSTFTPTAVPGLSQPTIAPYFADVDLRDRAGEVNPGEIRYCVDAVGNRVMVTWDSVVHYNATAATTDYTRVNTFQVILTPRMICGEAGVEAEYRYNELVWYVGTASGGLPDGTCADGTVGMSCFPAVAGVDYGDTVTATQLPGSLTTEVNSTLLTMSNVGMPGVWRIEINPSSIPSCGNGTVDGSCEDCDDSGESATCDSDCTFVMCGDGLLNTTAGETCDAGGETDTCDDDCTPPMCGDDNLNMAAGETCDDGNTADDDGCSSTCQIEGCGDGIVQTGEDCDDAGESATCDIDCTTPMCGDDVLNTTAGETCDSGGVNTADCDSDCSAPMCGDGLVNEAAGEVCDASGAATADCDSDCTAVECGDGRVNEAAGEECDDGGDNSDELPDACRTTCAAASCGDGVLDTGEGCDLGEDNGPDSLCSAECVPATCGDGIVNAGEECDEGEANSDEPGATCRTSCRSAGCGDAIVDPGEACDDGGENSDTVADACRTTCAAAGCGDGVVDSGESCDEGDANSDTAADACRTTCAPASCGDGVTDTGEECDDGNDADGDGCSARCANEVAVPDAGPGVDAGTDAGNADAGTDAGTPSAPGTFSGGALCSAGAMGGGDATWVLAIGLFFFLRRRRR